MRSAGRSRGIQWTVVAVALTVVVLLWVYLEGGPRALREHYGLLTPAVWIPCQVIVNLSPASDFLPWAVINGSLYGLWAGALMSWLAWLGSGSLQYAIARRTALDFDLDERLDALPAWLRRFPVGHPVFLVVGRWVPVASALVNVAAGALGVPYRRVAWCTALGAIPPALALAGLGAGLARAS